MVGSCVKRAPVLIAAVPLLVAACGHEPAGRAAIADDEFVASCIGLDERSDEPAALCVVDVGNGVTATLRPGIEPGIAPALSPDRRSIAVVDDGRIVVLTADGTERTSIELAAESVAWLDDGDTLVVHRLRTDGASIVEQHSVGSGTDPAVLLSSDEVGGEVEEGIAVSPESQRLAVAVHDGEQWKLIVADLVSGEQRTVLSSSEAVYAPAWSPDGGHLAVVAGAEIRTVDLATGTERLLATAPEPLTTPTWSPSGDRLLFVDARGAVVLTPITGGTQSVVVDLTRDREAGPFPAFPTWS